MCAWLRSSPWGLAGGIWNDRGARCGAGRLEGGPVPEGTGSVNPLPGSSSAWRAGRQQGRAVEQQEGSWGSVSTALRKSVFRCDTAKGPAGWASVLAVSSECRPRPRPMPWPGVLTGRQAFSFPQAPPEHLWREQQGQGPRCCLHGAESPVGEKIHRGTQLQAAGGTQGSGSGLEQSWPLMGVCQIN